MLYPFELRALKQTGGRTKAKRSSLIPLKYGIAPSTAASDAILHLEPFAELSEITELNISG